MYYPEMRVTQKGTVCKWDALQGYTPEQPSGSTGMGTVRGIGLGSGLSWNLSCAP